MALLKTHEEVVNWLDENNIKDYIINDNLSVDINGDVELFSLNAVLPIRFKNVSGYFDCSSIDLTTLLGCPSIVGGDFNCWATN